MKRTLALMFGLSFVLYLSGMSFGQGKGGHGPGGAPEIHTNHDRDVDHDNSHGKTETQEGHKDTNFEGRIERHPELKTKIESMLPPGENLKTAASGFKNEGQFLATLHVSKNLGIPFDQLKAKMMSSNPPMSLGQAIHALKPNLSEKEIDQVTDKAEKEAKADERTKSVTKPVT
jgi:hypothetical protein